MNTPASSKGSILAYSLILLSILLLVSLGMMTSSISNLRSSSSNDNSLNAFQVADSGSQEVVANIKKDTTGTLGDLASRMGLSCNNGFFENALLNGTYRVSFYGGSPDAQLSCSDTVSSITSLKSVGTYRDTARAVSVAVAAGCSEPGVMVKVISNSGSASFSGSDLTTIKNYAGDVSNKIVGIHCNSSTADALNFNVNGSTQIQADTFTASGSNAFYCSQGTGVCRFMGSDCSSGWAVYGMCAQ